MADSLDTPAAVAGRRRYVTVLFSDVSGSSEHAESLEAESYALLLEQFRQFVRHVVPRHGGSVARLQGDGVLALFGHLHAQEDDGRRAVEAALELHAAVSTLRVGSGAAATALQLHSGIHAGLVLLIEGDIERGRFDVVGEVPNTAARLCSLAGPGQVLVSQDTLGPQAQLFDTASQRGMLIRGRRAPLDVLRVAGRAAADDSDGAATRAVAMPFVGRRALLDSMARAADRVRAGETHTVLILGEPGIGKTRLIDEFQRGLDPTQFCSLHGACESYLGAELLQPFMQILRSAAARDAAPGVLEGKAQAGAAQHGAIAEWLRRQADGRALVLALDDWQWADDASRQVLDLLRAQQMPMLVLLAMRSAGDQDPALRNAQQLRLQALAPHEAEGAIGARLPGVDPFLLEEIVLQSGGSPLFIEALCHAAADGALPLAPGRQRSAAPVAVAAWINTLVASRLERLAPDQAQGLCLAAVVGNTVGRALLAQLMGALPAAALLTALEAQEFLVASGEPDVLRFKHLLTRDAVYATIGPAQRRALHLRVAQALEALRPAAASAAAPAPGPVSAPPAPGADDALLGGIEALAYHYDAAGVGDKAIQYAEAAGDKALATMALDRARAHYITALRALDALPALPRPLQLRWCGIAQKLGQTCVFDPLDVSHGLQLFERAAQLAHATGDANAVARAEYWLGYVNYGKGQARDAVRHCELALAHAQACADPRLAAQVRATLGQALASAGQYERALPLMRQAVEHQRLRATPGTRSAIGSAYTLARTGYTFGDLGRFDDAHACFDEALALIGGQTHSVAASVRELVCAVHLWQGRWSEARHEGLAGAEIALRCRSRYLTAMGRALAACAAWALERDHPALQALREPTQWIEARGGAVSTSLNYGWLVEGAVALGLADEARAHASRLFMRARSQDRHGQAMGCRALARLATTRQQPVQARRYLALADAAATVRDSPRERAVNLLALADWALAFDHPAQARNCAGPAAEAFERMAMPWHLRQAQTLMAQL